MYNETETKVAKQTSERLRPIGGGDRAISGIQTR